MLLSVIIVNYNVKYFLEQCLCSLQAAIDKIDAEVLVIDNCSSDGSINYLQPHFPWVTFIQNGANEGFAKANNKALQFAKGQYILFLNPDTLLAEDTLQLCIDFFAQHADAGAVGVRMIDGSGRFLPESKRAFPAPMVSFYKLTGLSALFPKSRIFNKYALGYLPENAVHEVDILAGAFMMVSKNAIDKTGSFDEQFFMYAEDIDLSYRIQKAGYKNYYLGNVSIVHFKGKSTVKGNLSYVEIFYRAMRLFVKKYYSGAGAWFINKGLYAGILLRQTVAALALPFNKKSNKNKAIVPYHIYVIGDRIQAETVVKILRKNNPKAILKSVETFKQMCADDKKSAVVFCTGHLTYKETIQLIQTSGYDSLVMWSGKHTRSIIGSNNKNAAGYVWH